MAGGFYRKVKEGKTSGILDVLVSFVLFSLLYIFSLGQIEMRAVITLLY